MATYVVKYIVNKKVNDDWEEVYRTVSYKDASNKVAELRAENPGNVYNITQEEEPIKPSRVKTIISSKENKYGEE